MLTLVVCEPAVKGLNVTCGKLWCRFLVVDDNPLMSIENLFEDLETQFEAQLWAQRSKAYPANAFSQSNLVEIYLQDGSRQTLIAPLLGPDFIAGVTVSEPKWQFIKLSTVIKIFFEDAGVESLPKLKQSDQPIIEFLSRLPLPIEVFWQANSGGEIRAGLLVDIQNELLLLQISLAMPLIGVPIESIGLLRIESVENFDEYL